MFDDSKSPILAVFLAKPASKRSWQELSFQHDTAEYFEDRLNGGSSPSDCSDGEGK